MSEPVRPIRVVVVDDHNVMRSGLKLLLTSDGMDVVGEADSGEAGIDVVRQLFEKQNRPDVVLMDVMMEGIGGIEATKRIKTAWPSLYVLILTSIDDRASLRDAFTAGASGYVLKDAVDVELLEAVRAVAEGGRYLHPSLGAELVRAVEESREGPSTAHGVPLSKREVDVMRLVALGYANKEIAEELFISVRTVETHKAHIMQKTGLRARSEMTRFAMDAGIIDPGGKS